MEGFARLFGSLLLFVYHCFDRVVIQGYLSGLSRPGQVTYFFHDVVGEPVIDKSVLSRRTQEYRDWVEAFARNHDVSIEWAEPKVRKEDYVRPAQRRMKRALNGVILDNLSSHKVDGVQQAIAAASATVLYLPPYSPDLNPIEKLFSKLKSLLRKAARRSLDALWTEIGQLLDTVSSNECANCFASSGYVLNLETLYALPALLAAQAIVICMYQYDWPLCVKIAHAIVG